MFKNQESATNQGAAAVSNPPCVIFDVIRYFPLGFGMRKGPLSLAREFSWICMKNPDWFNKPKESALFDFPTFGEYKLYNWPYALKYQHLSIKNLHRESIKRFS